MLPDWWLEHPKCEICRDKNNEGVEKPHICRGLAKDMREKTCQLAALENVFSQRLPTWRLLFERPMSGRGARWEHEFRHVMVN